MTPQDPSSETPDLVSQNIETIRKLSEERQRQVSNLHRPIERIFDFIARPTTLYVLMILVALWIVSSLLEQVLIHHSFDAPPFYALQGLLTGLSLFTTVIVLIVQSRQGKRAEQRAELELQVNLLAEQKIAKLIALLEEQRRDSPFLRDREDIEAAQMQQGANPQSILTALEEISDELSRKG